MEKKSRESGIQRIIQRSAFGETILSDSFHHGHDVTMDGAPAEAGLSQGQAIQHVAFGER